MLTLLKVLHCNLQITGRIWEFLLGTFTGNEITLCWRLSEEKETLLQEFDKSDWKSLHHTYLRYTCIGNYNTACLDSLIQMSECLGADDRRPRHLCKQHSSFHCCILIENYNRGAKSSPDSFSLFWQKLELYGSSFWLNVTVLQWMCVISASSEKRYS